MGFEQWVCCEKKMTSLKNTDRELNVGSKGWMIRHTESERQTLAWRHLHTLLPHDVLVKYAKPTDPSVQLAALALNLEETNESQRR